MTAIEDELWTLTWARRHIDIDAMADTVARALQGGPLDFRSKLLIRDTLTGLEERWGTVHFVAWAEHLGISEPVRGLLCEDLGKPGFRSMETRLMKPTSAETVRSLFRDLGLQMRHPARIVVGGAIALILGGRLSRATEDVDVVDELPVEVRTSHEVLRELAERHGLALTHFQSHYLPTGWKARTWSFERFGSLDVEVVDAYDVVIGKLFSRRTKDFDDVRTLLPELELPKLKSRIASTTASFRADPTLLEAAERNWYVLTGNALPPAKTA